MEDLNRTIYALTSMIEVNNKRMKVYRNLAEKMHNSDLRTLFRNYAEQSKTFSGELSTWRSAYGGFAMPQAVGGSIWAQVSNLFDHWFSKNVASKCEEMELEAIKLYKTVMEKAFFPHDAAKDIERQSKEFDKALTKLRTLQENNRSAREELVHTHAL